LDPAEGEIEMMWYGGFGAMGLLWPLAMLLFWGGVVVLVVWALRAFSSRSVGHDGAQEILRRRLASGEITQAEYEQARKAMQG
jgi:uncharacterized membrane protein